MDTQYSVDMLGPYVVCRQCVPLGRELRLRGTMFYILDCFSCQRFFLFIIIIQLPAFADRAVLVLFVVGLARSRPFSITLPRH